MRYTRDDFIFVAPSKRNGKKYDVYSKDNKYITSFGAIKPDGTPYEQYTDKIGHYSKYDHKDKARRDRYRKRHDGEQHTKYTAGWFSWNYLW